MLSGIGDEAELRKFGITPVVHLPGVGKNMQDRYEVGIVSQAPKPFALLRRCKLCSSLSRAASPMRRWPSGRPARVSIPSNGAAIAVTKRSSPDKVDPDLFIFGLPSFFKGYYPWLLRRAGAVSRISSPGRS